MRITLGTSIVILAVLTAAAPQPGGQNMGMAIPIVKRSGLTNTDKSVCTEALKYHAASTKAYVVFFLCFTST
jgi:cathepsin D